MLGASHEIDSKGTRERVLLMDPPAPRRPNRERRTPCEFPVATVAERRQTMGWHLRIWRRTKIAPGVSLNWSKSGPSVSVGPRGAKVTVGRRGVRQSIGIPGSGLFATNQQSWDSVRRGHTEAREPGGEPRAAALPTAGVNATSTPATAALEACGFCGGQVGTNGRCEMCGQPVERWRDA